jgi:hypothetical protein
MVRGVSPGAWQVLEDGPVDEVERAYDRRVLAVWGLTVRTAHAMPFALEMLKDGNPEIRADATGVLDHLGRDPAAIAALVRIVDSETDRHEN